LCSKKIEYGETASLLIPRLLLQQKAMWSRVTWFLAMMTNNTLAVVGDGRQLSQRGVESQQRALRTRVSLDVAMMARGDELGLFGGRNCFMLFLRINRFHDILGFGYCFRLSLRSGADILGAALRASVARLSAFVTHNT
jgi:hypothetical protein